MDNTGLTLAKVIPVKELKGWLGKELMVPAEQLGVAMDARQQLVTFPPGKHRLVSAWERLTGKAIGLELGLIPTGPVEIQIQDAYLYSGDDILLDITLTASAVVSDPGCFFTEVVIPRGGLPQAAIDLSNESAHASLSALARRYAAADLIHGLPTAHLADDVRVVLQPFMQSQGLTIQSIDLMLFWKSDDKVAAQEKIQVLEERLQDLEIRKKMAQVENQAELDDFIHQLQPESTVEVGFRPIPPAAPQPGAVANQPATAAQTAKEPTPAGGQPLTPAAPAKPGEKAAPQSSLGSTFSKALVRLKATASTLHLWRVGDLFKGKKQAASVNQNAAAPLQAIGVTRTIYILGLLLVGVSMTGLAIWLAAQGASWERILPFLTVVWIAVVHQILDSLKKIIERREEIRQANWIQPGGSRLEDLAGRDSQQTDRLVRQQCGEELERCRDILNDIRSRVYKAGQMDLALSLRDLERKFDASRGRVLDTQVGAPPYLDATLHITSKAWDPMLAYDEDLLCAASALSQKAAALQQLAPDGIPPQGMKDLESQLDGFMNRFSARGRALQPPVKI